MKKVMVIKFPYSKIEQKIYSDDVEFQEYVNKIFYPYVESQEMEDDTTVSFQVLCDENKRTLKINGKKEKTIPCSMCGKALFGYISCTTKFFKKVFFAHGALMEYRDIGFLLLAKSGTGKSTLAAYLQLMYESMNCLNDDRVIVSTEKMLAYPCGRGINLREGAKNILSQMFEIASKKIELCNNERWYVCNKYEKKEVSLKFVFIISRLEEEEGILIPLKYEEAVASMLCNSFICNDIANSYRAIAEIAKKISVYKINSNNLNIAGKQILKVLGDTYE